MQKSLEIIKSLKNDKKIAEENNILEGHKKNLKVLIRSKIEYDAQLFELERLSVISNLGSDSSMHQSDIQNKVNLSALGLNGSTLASPEMSKSVHELSVNLTERKKRKAMNDVDLPKLEKELRVAVECMKVEGANVMKAENSSEIQKENLAVMMSDLNVELHTKTAELMVLKTTIEKNFIDLQRNMRKKNKIRSMSVVSQGDNDKYSSIEKFGNNSRNYQNSEMNIKNDHEIVYLENEINELITFYRLEQRNDISLSLNSSDMIFDNPANFGTKFNEQSKLFTNFCNSEFS